MLGNWNLLRAFYHHLVAPTVGFLFLPTVFFKFFYYFPCFHKENIQPFGCEVNRKIQLFGCKYKKSGGCMNWLIIRIIWLGLILFCVGFWWGVWELFRHFAGMGS